MLPDTESDSPTRHAGLSDAGLGQLSEAPESRQDESPLLPAGVWKRSRRDTKKTQDTEKHKIVVSGGQSRRMTGSVSCLFRAYKQRMPRLLRRHLGPFDSGHRHAPRMVRAHSMASLTRIPDACGFVQSSRLSRR